MYRTLADKCPSTGQFNFKWVVSLLEVKNLEKSLLEIHRRATFVRLLSYTKISECFLKNFSRYYRKMQVPFFRINLQISSKDTDTGSQQRDILKSLQTKMASNTSNCRRQIQIKFNENCFFLRSYLINLSLNWLI